MPPHGPCICKRLVTPFSKPLVSSGSYLHQKAWSLIFLTRKVQGCPPFGNFHLPHNVFPTSPFHVIQDLIFMWQDGHIYSSKPPWLDNLYMYILDQEFSICPGPIKISEIILLWHVFLSHAGICKFFPGRHLKYVDFSEKHVPIAMVFPVKVLI